MIGPASQKTEGCVPIAAQWWRLSEVFIQVDQDAPGVYELGDASGTVVYIGSSYAIRRKLREHMGESATSCIKRYANRYRIEYTLDYGARARQLYDEHVRGYGVPPRCNDLRP